MAAWLERSARHELTLCTRRPLGELTMTFGDTSITLRAPAFSDPERAPAVDWVLVATKAYDCSGAAAWFERLCARRARVAVLQNGVEHRERFRAWLPSERMVPVMVDCPAERLSPTQIRQRGPAKMAVADAAAGHEFAALFAGTPVAVEISADFKSALWRKLCVNCAGAISALALQPAGVMRSDRIAELARGLVRECIAVGRAEGAELDDALADRVVDGYRSAPIDSVNSLHADRAAHRATEFDARNGVIVRLGRSHGIPTPLNEMATALLEAAQGERERI